MTLKTAEFISDAVPTVEDALAGAHEIIAEGVGDTAEFRSWITAITRLRKDCIKARSKMLKKDEKGVYEMYYDFQHPINKMVSHRILATNRGTRRHLEGRPWQMKKNHGLPTSQIDHE